MKKMGNTFKRFLALALAVFMVVGMMPTNIAFATEDEGEITYCEHGNVASECETCNPPEDPSEEPSEDDTTTCEHGNVASECETCNPPADPSEEPSEDPSEEPSEDPDAGVNPAADEGGENQGPITGTITEDMVWNDGDVIGGVTIAGNVTITVKGTVTVTGTIRLNPDVISNVVFNGENDAKLIRGNDFTGQMFYAEGVSGNFQNLTFNNITLDGGAVWTGDVDATLNRGTTNSGVKATGSVLYLVYANADLNNSTLQNHDDSTGEKANAVFLRYYSTIDFNNSVVRDNNSISTYYRGGVITVRQGGTVKTNNAEVYGNSGKKGGFYGTSSTGSFGGVVEVTNSKFYNNYAANGAVFDMQCNSNKGYLLIDGCEFYENASDEGLIYEHAYSRPVIIKDSYFHDNECAVWDCHAAPVLDISGKIVITEDADYTKYLFETPLVLTGALAEDSSIAMSEASITKLVGSAGYIATGTADYAVTEADMAKFVLPEGKKLITVDVNFDGILDVVPVADEFVKTAINVTLKDSKNESTAETRTVYANIAYKYNCDAAYTGFVFTGWLNSTDNKTSTAIMAFEADATLTAKWKLANPAVTVSSKDEGANINTLVATVTNQGEGITYAYQWYKDGTAIEGATSAEYTIDATAKYKCMVTASLDGYKTVTGSKEVTAELKEVPKNYVAQVGETKYESLQAAVKAAMPGDTIIVIADHEMDCGNPVTNSDGFSALVNVAGKAVTIDLNGKTITVSPKAEQFTDAEGSMLMSVFAVDTNGTLTLKDSIGTGKVAVTANDANVYSLAVCYGEGGKLNIEGGSYTADEVSSALIYSQHDEVVTITGGNFHLGNVGTGSNGSPWIFNASGQNTKNIIVVGGTYNADIFHQYYIFEVKDTTEVAELLGVPVKAAKNNGDGTWTVVDAVAYVDEQHKSGNWYTQNTGYVTLEEAIAASGKYVNDTKGYTVTLVADAEVTGNVTVPEATKLVCGDYKVVLAAANATLTAPADLTVTTNVANGKVVCENGTHKVVVSTPVAEVNGTQYESLAEAVAAANAIEGGATVTLLKDVTLGEKLTISGNVTISGAYTITRDAAYTGTLFEVASGATLTLDGGLVVDGGNAWVYTKTPLEMDMANGAGTKVADHITPAEGGVNATAHLIVNNGTLNANKVTIQNSYSTNGVSAIDCGASSVTTINGATLQNIAANRSGAVVYVGGADAVLTIKGDTRITGNFGTGNGGIIQNYGQGTTVNLEGGSIDNNHVGKSGTVYASYSSNAEKINTFNMSGGIITKNIMEGYGPVYIHTNTVWNMTGGEISENTSYLPSYVRNNNPAGTMSGGKIVNNEITCGDYSNGYYVTHPDLRLNGKTPITGGTFTQDVSEYLAPNTGLAYDEATGTYTVTDHVYNLYFRDPVTGEQVQGVGPLKGNNAASLVATGKLFYADYYVMELEVLSNVKIDETIVIDYPMTVNLNGHTISATAAIQSSPVIRVLADVTVTGEGKIDGRGGESCYAFIVGNSETAGNLTIENGTFYGDVSAVSVTKGNLTINGGKFAVNPYVVEGQEDNYNYLLNCIDANYTAGTAKIFVKGGTFYKFNPADNEAETGDHTNFVAEGYEVSADGDYYTVNKAKTYVAQVGETKYESLAEAVAAANAIEGGATVTLLADVALDEMLTISGNVTIEGAYTITWADGYTGTLINVDSGASVKLKNLTIDGENAFTFYDDTTTVENGQNWYTRFVNVGEEDKAVNADVIVNAGNLTLMGVTIKNVTIASDNANGKTENTETGYVLKYNDDLAIIKSNGGSVVITNNGSSTKNTKISGNAGLVLNAINANTQIIGNSVIEKNMGCGNKGGIIIANGGTMEISGASGIVVNKAMARSATILGVINGAEVTFGGLVDYGGDELYDDGTSMSYNKHIGVGSNTAGAMIVLEGASRFVMNGGTIWDNAGGRAGAIASRWVGGSYGQHEETSIVLNAGSIKRNTASNDSWNGASIFLRSPATIGEGMTIDGTIAVNAAPGALEITGGTFNGELIVTDGLTAEITGGTFNYDPSAWCAEGYMAETKDEGATYTVRKANYVAQVGETKYTSLQAAINACTNGETVKLIADIVYDADDVVYAHGGATGFGDYDRYNPSIIYVGGTRVDGVNSPSNVNVVIDLNGHTITNNADAYLFLFMDNCKVKFMDSQNGKGIIGNTAAPIIWVTGTDTLVTIESGKYTTVNAEGLIWATHSGDLVINGGEFSTTADDASLLIIRNSQDRQNSKYFISGKSTVTVNGGSFVGFNPEKMQDDSTTPFTEFNAVTEGYAAIYDEAQNTYTVVDYIKWIKDELLAGNDVILDRDIVVDGSYVESIPDPVNGNGKYPNYGIFNVYGDTVTIDLNGYDVTYNGHASFEWNGKTYNSCTVAHGLFFANAGANLTIKDGKGTSDITVYGLASGAYAAAPNTVLTVEGGNWKNEGCAECGGTNIFLYPLQGATLNITGGTFEQALDSEGESYLIVEHGGEYKGETIDYSLTNVEITGGTFVGMNPAEIKYFQQTADNKLVMGETTDGCAKGYKAVDNGDGTWTVEPNMIFEFHLTDANGEAHWLSPMRSNDINSLIKTCKVWYESLQGTYDFTLKILESYELDEPVQANFPMTIDLGKITLSSAGDAIIVTDGATVTIEGEGAVKGGTSGVGSWTAVWANGGDVVINGGTYSVGGDSTTTDTTHQNDVIYTKNGGTVTINGGTFLNDGTVWTLNENDANRGTITVKGGTFQKWNPENNASEGPNTNFVAEGYKAVADGENWIVKEKTLIDFAGTTMNLGNELAITFYLKTADLDGTDYYAVITKEYADGRENVTVKIPYSEWIKNGSAYIGPRFNGVAAKEMTDNIYVQIFNGNDEVVSVLRTDSVRAFAMRGLSNSTFTAEQKIMLVDMLNYGAEAQDYFDDYHIDDLANALLSDDQKALATDTVEYSNQRDTTNAGGYYAGSTLTLENNILMTLYFKNITRDMRAVVSFTDHYGNAKEIEVSGSEFKANGSYLGVVVDELVVADARQMVTVKIYDGDTLLSTVADSIESNAARSSGALFEAIMKFAVSAYEMFH